MAGKGLVIPLSLSPKKWVDGLRVVDRSLERFEDDLGDVEDAGDRLGRKLEDVFDQAADDARRAGRDINDNIADGADGIGEVGAEFGDEFVQSWGEAVRSGDPGEAIGETITNSAQLLSVLGPAGAVAGLGIAAAAGFVTNFIQQSKEEAQRIGDVAASFFDTVSAAAREDGANAYRALRDGFVDEANVDAQLTDALGVDNIRDAWLKVGETVQDTGLDVETVTQAYLGNEEALGRVEDALGVQRRLLFDASDIAEETGQHYSDVAGAITDQIGDLERVLELGGQIADENERSAEAFRVQAQYAAQIYEGSVMGSYTTADYFRDYGIPGGTVNTTPATRGGALIP